MLFDDKDKIAHKKLERAMSEGKTCIDCHKGIAHELPDQDEKVS